MIDPTSGSGSLLINIGNSVSKHVKDPNKIKYYAQELKQNTYNLTRMNLIMRGILPDNIVARNGDTLEDDWPFFDDKHEYSPLYIDAVVSNPPYSQPWASADKESDVRYKNYGLAPKTKADFAFLLHDLYHLKGDGIMTIVLPHGVLFRGGEEKEIRKNLIEKNNIDTIIGLPANIFFGTGIPTIIMILKKQSKKDTNIQIIDASKGYVKDGKNNLLRASDIKKIVDTVINRIEIPKYSKIVSREEVRENDYNLNIPRYVDSSDEQESFDIYASMFGGIPNSELDKFNTEFKEFPNLKNDLFEKINDNFCEIKKDNVLDFIRNHDDVIKYKNNFLNQFSDLNNYLKSQLMDNIEDISIANMENVISEEIFKRIKTISLIDKYKAYQILDNEWNTISGDLELIKSEGIDTCKKIDPKVEVKKKNNVEEEVQVGWQGHIIPFDLVAEYKLNDEKNTIIKIKNKIEEIVSEYQEILDSLTEDDKQEITDLLNENNDAFIPAKVSTMSKELRKTKINYTEDDINYKVLKVDNLILEEKELRKKSKISEIDLEKNSKIAIENLSIDEVNYLLEIKWIKPIVNNINNMIDELINEFTKEIEKLSKKYDITLLDIETDISKTEKEISNQIDDLTGNDFDMMGLMEFKKLLNGDTNE